MTTEEHILHLMQTASQEIDRKYHIGQREHGGNLWEKFNLLEYLYHAREEAIDQFVYIQCAIDRAEQTMYRMNQLEQEEKACTAGQS